MTSPISDLERQVRATFPDVAVQRLRMKVAERADAIDLRKGDRLITVLWTDREGLSVTEIDDDGVFDDEVGYVVRSVDEALQVLAFLLGAAVATDLHGVDDPARKAA